MLSEDFVDENFGGKQKAQVKTQVKRNSMKILTPVYKDLVNGSRAKGY